MLPIHSWKDRGGVHVRMGIDTSLRTKLAWKTVDLYESLVGMSPSLHMHPSFMCSNKSRSRRLGEE
jgi:hypothetical protein